MLKKEFFLGGNSTFTVQNDKTGEYRTYKIHLTEPNERFPVPAYMVALMTGPDNVNSYTYMGKLDPQTGSLKVKTVEQGGRFTEDCAAVKGFRWTMNKVFTNSPIPTYVQVRHEGRCGCCGRKLTTPESLDRGIGPECWARLGGAA